MLSPLEPNPLLHVVGLSAVNVGNNERFACNDRKEAAEPVEQY
jgi:hypothetical protein